MRRVSGIFSHRRLAWAVGLAWAVALLADPAQAQTLIAGRSHVVPIPNHGHDSSRRVGTAAAHGQSEQPLLVSNTVVVRKKGLGRSLRYPPLQLSNDELLLYKRGVGLVRIGAAGRQKWTYSMGWLGPLAAPSLAANGDVVVINGESKLLCVSGRGKLKWSRSLEADEAGKRVPAPLVLRDGSIVVAINRWLYRFGPAGQLLAKTSTVRSRVDRIWDSSKGILVLNEGGELRHWVGFGRLRFVGRFGGPSRGTPAAINERYLVAVVAPQRLEVVDMATRKTRILLRQTSFASAPVYDRHANKVLVVVRGGALIAIDSAGRATVRASLTRNVVGSGAALVPGAPFFPKRSPAPGGQAIRYSLGVGSKGAVAFARHGASLGWVGAKGPVQVAAKASRSCHDWLGLRPLPSGRVVASCAAGWLMEWGPSKR